MALKKDIKAWLKEISLKEADVDAMWDELKGLNGLVAQLARSEVDWRTLNMHVIRQIPTQKERDLQRIEDERIKEEQEAREAAEKKAAAEHYANNFEAIMVKKIDTGEILVEDEIRTLVHEYATETYEDSELGRWAQHVQTIVELCGRFFSINWSKGLTEYQPNEYPDQPVEVFKRQFLKTILVTEWNQTKPDEQE